MCVLFAKMLSALGGFASDQGLYLWSLDPTRGTAPSNLPS